MTIRPCVHSPFRWPLSAALFVAAAVHVPVTPEHLREAPYMGVAFALFTVTATLLAVVVAWRGSVRVVMAALLLCAGAVGTYAATRVVAFPQLADDVGNWTETLGVVSVLSEAAVVGIAFIALRGSVLRVPDRLLMRRPAQALPDATL